VKNNVKAVQITMCKQLLILGMNRILDKLYTCICIIKMIFDFRQFIFQNTEEIKKLKI